MVIHSHMIVLPFEESHLCDAARLSAAAGWPHRAEDWEMMLGLSKGVVAIHNDHVIATALATPYGSRATANMIVVEETMRGRGIGRKIMKSALALFTPEAWHLVATEEGLPLYRKLGFETCGSVRQFQGGVVLPDPSGLATQETLSDIRRADETHLEALIECDRQATGMDRSGLVRALFRRGRIVFLEDNGTPVAWAALRRFGRGEVVGPVIARSLSEARLLIANTIYGHVGKFLRVDIPGDVDLANWLESFGLQRVGGGTEMVLGKPADTNGKTSRYALAAQALW